VKRGPLKELWEFGFVREVFYGTVYLFLISPLGGSISRGRDCGGGGNSEKTIPFAISP